MSYEQDTYPVGILDIEVLHSDTTLDSCLDVGSTGAMNLVHHELGKCDSDEGLHSPSVLQELHANSVGAEFHHGAQVRPGVLRGRWGWITELRTNF